MPFYIVRNDITKMDCDAIVNATNSNLYAGGGVDAAIHSAAGPEIETECKKIGSCKPGTVVVTGGYNLPSKYVIHTVGPKWSNGYSGEEVILSSCYKQSLKEAEKLGCESIAFPLIAAGTFGFPKDRALEIAKEEITDFVKNSDIDVYLVVYDKTVFELSKKLSDDVREYITQNYIDAKGPSVNSNFIGHVRESRFERYELEERIYPDAQMPQPSLAYSEVERKRKPKKSLLGSKVSKPKKEEPEIKAFTDYDEDLCDKALAPEPVFNCKEISEYDFNLDASFGDTLISLIDKKGMTDPECYKKANVDRKLFSKIKNNKDYKPSKKTAIAFAIALELSISETNDLISRAGYVLTRSSLFDVIIMYFLENKNYDLYTINEVLFDHDLETLGV